MLAINEENDILILSKNFLVRFKPFGQNHIKIRLFSIIMNRVLFMAINEFIKQALIPLIADER